MKGNKYICLILIVLVLIAAVSCSADFGKNVYYGGISGVVKDKDSGNGVSGVKVYLYTSQSERDAAFSKWQENGGIFSDEKCLYKSSTDSNGKWTVNKVVWMAKDGAWGSDYDHIPVFIIYFSEDYGCWQEEKIELVSGTSNTNAIESKRENIKDNSKLTINFREENKQISDEITFTYSYNDGYSDRTEKVSTTNGQYTINNISYVKNENGTTVKISDIKTPNNCWDISSFLFDGNSVDGDISIEVNEASVTKDINLKRTMYDLGESGISGRITAPRSVVMDASGKSLEHSLDSLIIVTTINGNTYSVLSGNGNYDSDTAGSFSVDFSSLAVNEKVNKIDNTVVEIKVYKQDTEDFSSGELASTKLNLNTNYSNKNSVSIFIDSWT